MKTKTTKSILAKAIKTKFGSTMLQKHFADQDYFDYFSLEQEQELIDHFAIDGYFLDHPLFDTYREKKEFQRFYGAFYRSSTLDLLLKLYLLKDILNQAQQRGIYVFTVWTPFFQDAYNRDFLTKRNLEWDIFLEISRNQNTRKTHKK